MMRTLSDQPFIFIAFVVVMMLLWIGASIRIRHDRLLRHRAKVDRRNKLRVERDRRWNAREPISNEAAKRHLFNQDSAALR
jgi:hypothetical protein